jgi:hypothetical protein
METKQRSIRLWNEGPVDRASEHMLLNYGEATAGGEWLPVVLIARDRGLTFKVQFLISPTEGNEQAGEILQELRQELDTYLIGEYPLEVWDEAKYRCAITSGPGTTIHWNYFPEGDDEPHLCDRLN